MSSKPRFAALAVVASRRPQKTIEDRRPQSERFGEMTFSLKEAQHRLPKEAFKKYRETATSGTPLDTSIAPVVAHAMKEWAIDNGVTHFTHWFQPMTGITAEKHDSFLSYEGAEVIERFNAKELVQGEPDASSFPSGGIRATFEARGYTAWDPATPAFLMPNPNGKTLCIPTAFVSYTGESLDEKTPLLRSIEAVSAAAVRLLKVLGRTDVHRVSCTVGPEQEYFLIDRALYALRPDLVACGRTVFGAPSPKGQELEDQYFGAIKERVMAVMTEVEHKMIGLGTPVKTRHNEVAPGQYECAPIFEIVNRAADHNLILLEAFRKIAARHDLTFLDHEKPFAGINGSGKHNNWSMATDGGENLLEPGHTPAENVQFLLFLAATVRAVHRHGGLLRSSVATAANDHRLGANEAPPAIMSVFLGEELQDVLDQIEKGGAPTGDRRRTMELGVTTIPAIARDTTDRNRTSPFAFTGNKFEFRAVGSSMNISWSNVVINTMVAESLTYVTDQLEAAMKQQKVDAVKAAARVMPKLIAEFKPVVFNGDNYASAWHEEAAKRGLANDRDTPTALKHLLRPETVKMFETYKVLSAKEIESRYTVKLESYCKRVAIEARVAIEMARTGAVPAALSYLKRITAVRAALSSAAAAEPVTDLERVVLDLFTRTQKGVKKLEESLRGAHGASGVAAEAEHFRTVVIPAMLELRAAVDGLEQTIDDDLWPYPKYREMLFHA
ncbi:MAG: glutamine synthetase III [Deltaproteobacteria bacterium]|nr:glutamine synthetase III [Deltaproteobacteria bacterium]